ncbi:phosphoglycerate mutase-like protein [Tothia fuscella]|uniref:Phosphoglycerate mutase-like protein n=1 Tax=Tothia fuscella TaxID=1048955 RepID=A0A9P4NYD6_9PEZI|nr:phosphoglycerate mutase-like protein [Tothia fuscella]
MINARVLTASTGIFALLILLYNFWSYTSSNSIPRPLGAYFPVGQNNPQGPIPKSLPFTSGRTSWFHPQSWLPSTTSSQNSPKGTKHKWNILYHLGGNGPWIQKVDGIVDGGIGPPEGCEVEQVHMMSRHAERYPTIRAGIRMLDLVDRIKADNVTLTGPLSFVKDWEWFASDGEASFEQLTTTGPYAGTLDAFTTGVRLRTRYSHLLSGRISPGGSKTSFWASGSERVVDTARYFAAGFWGLERKDSETLHVIPETAELGGDTLTPGDTCLAYQSDTEYGHDQGAAKLVEFSNTYLPAIAERLETFISTAGSKAGEWRFRFTNDEVYALQEMCGFETTVRGSSPWCGVFTHDEWESFEYARDVIHFYRAGPGTKYAKAMGSLWLNATAGLLLNTLSAGPFFMSFVHDGDIVPMLAALNLYHDKNPLPVTHIPKHRAWKTSQVTPMMGRVIFERIHCPNKSQRKDELQARDQGDTYFVRINVNDGIVAIPGCEGGPGKSCPLDEFVMRIRKNQQEGGDFREVCGLGSDAPDRITFLHQ